MEKIKSSEITPEHIYRSRRQFMKGIGAIALGSLALSACGSPASPATPESKPNSTVAPNTSGATPTTGSTASTDTLTSFDDITHYNNYYEFSQLKEPVADLAANFKTSPWKVEVGGMVSKPMTYDIDDLRKKFPQQDRVY